MKIFLKFFGCILFASIAVSLQAFTVENRSHYDITIAACEEVQIILNGLPSMRPILPKEVIIKWNTGLYNETLPVEYEQNDFYGFKNIILKSGCKAEIVMDENIKTYHLSLCYSRENYSSRGSREHLEIRRLYVSPNDTFVFETPDCVLRQEFNTSDLDENLF